jgi:hypothetical protein
MRFAIGRLAARPGDRISVMGKAKRTVFILLLTPLLVHSQVGTGTILIFQIQKRKFIMAADSRAMLQGKANDGNCKIAAFDKSHLVFGVTNGPKYIPFPGVDFAPAWDAIKEAEKALKTATISKGDASAKVNAVADAWAKNMQLDWQGLYLIHPDLVRKVALDEKQGLTHGVFAMEAEGQLALVARGIKFENGAITIESPEFVKYCWAPELCASGMLDIFNEYTRKTSQRAKDEKWEFPPSLLERTSPDMLKIVKLVELTIAYDPSGTVGGKIDAVELDVDGSIHWFQNPNCPSTYE